MIAQELEIEYDFLILATGAAHSYFGHEEWEAFAPGLKRIEDATEIRRRILLAFERAELTDDPAERRRLLTVVVIGGGPTGVEMAGAIAELARHTLRREFRRYDPAFARILLLEAGERTLPALPVELADYAARTLKRLGVEVMTSARVTSCERHGVILGTARIEAATLIWAADVAASPAGGWIGADHDSRTHEGPGGPNRPRPSGDLRNRGHGSVPESVGPVPGIAPAAKQMGAYLAKGDLGKVHKPFEARSVRPSGPPWPSAGCPASSASGVHAALCQLGHLPVIAIAFIQGSLHRLRQLLFAHFVRQRLHGAPGGDAVVLELLHAGDHGGLLHLRRPHLAQDAFGLLDDAAGRRVLARLTTAVELLEASLHVPQYAFALFQALVEHLPEARHFNLLGHALQRLGSLLLCVLDMLQFKRDQVSGGLYSHESSPGLTEPSNDRRSRAVAPPDRLKVNFPMLCGVANCCARSRLQGVGQAMSDLVPSLHSRWQGCPQAPAQFAGHQSFTWDFPSPGPGGPPWWQSAVLYQIYPLSFQDSDGDGMGDLPGILSRLDHLSWLGVDAVWLSPVYCSPMNDFGYDIADFTAVDAIFGTLADLDRLTAALHQRGMKLILDFVPNHTSDRHPWFQESRSSRDHSKRDWYIWSDPGPGGGPPNNWLSRFGGSAWEWDEATGQYYYHAFLKSQPDLNWRNADVRQAMHDVLRFWMRRGIDGFRVDAAAVLVEDDRLRDDPPNPQLYENTPPPERFERVHTDARPVSLRYISELRNVIDEFPDRVLLGEVDTTPDKVRDFYGEDGCRLHLPLNYCLLDTPWRAHAVEQAICRYLASLPPEAFPDWVLGSHDKNRMASQVGAEQARVAAMLALTLPGMAVTFAGDEIGMRDVPVSSAEARDPLERRVPGYGLNRDPHRAPMRWSAGPQAGFTTGQPWLPIGEDVEKTNINVHRQDPRSLANLHRALIRLRKSEPILQIGSFELVGRFGEVLAFRRRLGGRALAVFLNFHSSGQDVPASHPGRVRLSTYLDRAGDWIGRAMRLRPNEGVILG